VARDIAAAVSRAGTATVAGRFQRHVSPRQEPLRGSRSGAVGVRRAPIRSSTWAGRPTRWSSRRTATSSRRWRACSRRWSARVAWWPARSKSRTCSIYVRARAGMRSA